MLWLVGAAIMFVEISQRISAPPDQLWTLKGEKHTNHWEPKHLGDTYDGKRELPVELVAFYLSHNGEVSAPDSDSMRNFSLEDIQLLQQVIAGIKKEKEHSSKHESHLHASNSNHHFHTTENAKQHAVDVDALLSTDNETRNDDDKPKDTVVHNENLESDSKNEEIEKKVDTGHLPHKELVNSVESHHVENDKNQHPATHSSSNAAEDTYLGKNYGEGN